MSKQSTFETRVAALAGAFKSISVLVKRDPSSFPELSGPHWGKLAKALVAGGTARLDALRAARAALRRERQPSSGDSEIAVSTPPLSLVMKSTKRPKKEEQAMDVTQPKKRKRKKSKITKLAKAAALEGGLNWQSLTKNQKARLKNSVRADRVLAKLSKTTPAVGITDGVGKMMTPGVQPQAAAAVDDEVEVVALKKVLVESRDEVAVAKARARLDQLGREAVRKSLRQPRESSGWGFDPPGAR